MVYNGTKNVRMGFAAIIRPWRGGLASDTERTCYAGVEQKVRRYFLWRHADAPYAEPLALAEPLPTKDATRSAMLSVSEETRLRLGPTSRRG